MVNSCIPRLLAYPSISCQRFVFSYASAPDIVPAKVGVIVLAT